MNTDINMEIVGPGDVLTTEVLSVDGLDSLAVPVNINQELDPTEPLGWCNSVGINFGEDDDSITFTMSVGDPRGHLAIQFFRAGNGEVRMSIPGEDHPHAKVIQHVGADRFFTVVPR